MTTTDPQNHSTKLPQKPDNDGELAGDQTHDEDQADQADAEGTSPNKAPRPTS